MICTKFCVALPPCRHQNLNTQYPQVPKFQYPIPTVPELQYPIPTIPIDWGHFELELNFAGYLMLCRSIQSTT